MNIPTVAGQIILNGGQMMVFSKSDEKAKFVRQAITLLDKLGADSERQIYLKHIKQLSGVPVDVLQRDVFNRVTEPTEQQEYSTETLNIEDGTNRAIKCVLASMLYKKEYVNYSFPLKKYLNNNTYVRLYDLIMNKRAQGQEYKVSLVYDEFDVNNEPNLVDIISYNFEQNGD